MSPAARSFSHSFEVSPHASRSTSPVPSSGVELVERGQVIRIAATGVVLLLLLAGRMGCAGGWAGMAGVVKGDAGVSSGSSGVSEEQAAAIAPKGTGAPIASQSWRFVDAAGRERTLAEFQGRPFVVTLVYTRCPTVCPRTVSALLRFQREAGGRVPIVLVSLDPVHDTPAVLAAFARTHALEGDTWTLLTPDASVLPPLASAMGVAWGPSGEGGIAHSAVIAFIDADGRVVERRFGTENKPAEWKRIWERMLEPSVTP